MKANTIALTFGAVSLALCAGAAEAQNPPADHPQVTVRGVTYTPRSILARNMGTTADQETAFPPHKIAGNIYYVGTRTLPSFLVTTPAGNILINSTYERNVPTIAKSVESLGFKFSDTKILLGTHAHGDHQEGDAQVKQMTGAQVVTMAEDVEQLRGLKPGGKDHPIDRIIKNGDTVSLGGVTLTAHLTPGHTHGCTTYTTTVNEGGRNYNVVFFCSIRSGVQPSAQVKAEFERTYAYVRTLPCDIPLSDHGAGYRMQEKYAKLAAGGPNPFVEPGGCFLEADIQEAMYKAQLAEDAAGK
jgi:metallo-beta-lactamase class B